MRISDWSSDVCSSDLGHGIGSCLRTPHRARPRPSPSPPASFGQLRSAILDQLGAAILVLDAHRAGAGIEDHLEAGADLGIVLRPTHQFDIGLVGAYVRFFLGIRKSVV